MDLEFMELLELQSQFAEQRHRTSAEVEGRALTSGGGVKEGQEPLVASFY